MEENRKDLKADGSALSEDELEKASGGASRGAGGGTGFYLIVGNCNGSYLALRPEPRWDQYHELARLWPGYQVFTYGATSNGTGLNGTHCEYTYVSYNGIWGWANSAFLH